MRLRVKSDEPVGRTRSPARPPETATPHRLQFTHGDSGKHDGIDSAALPLTHVYKRALLVAMRKPVALVAVLAAAAVLVAVVALGSPAAPRAPTAVIDGWPIGAPKGICADPVCADMTRQGLAALDIRFPMHAAVLSSALYGLGTCVDRSPRPTVLPTSAGAQIEEVLVVTLADGAVHAFGLGGGLGVDPSPHVAPPLDAPSCATGTSGPAG